MYVLIFFIHTEDEKVIHYLLGNFGYVFLTYVVKIISLSELIGVD